MSMPEIVHPWSLPMAPADSVSLVSVTEPAAIEPAVPEHAAPVANALFAAGFVSAAIALADASGDAALIERASAWRDVAASDAVVAATIGAGAGAIVPSVATRADGAPRFMISAADADAAVTAIAREHGEHGVDAELRLFLDEALRDGDRFVDAAPGDGFAVLSAATGIATTSVIALCDDAGQAAAITASAHWSGVSAQMTASADLALDQVPFATSSAATSTILHVGSAGAVAPMLRTVRGALERGEIGVVAWRCGRSGETGRDAENLQVAAAVLGVFGFQHFSLADGEQGTELVPAEAMASNEMIFSIEPTFLARFAA